jgi:succinate dehydrogenase / fumarate reductase flavoprotein subunit
MIDILIIGSGGAALSCALEAKKSGSKVLVVSKTYPTHSQTSQAQGGINAVMDESSDSIQNHINDTLRSAHNLGDSKAIEVLCNNAKNTIHWLDSLGVPFSRDYLHNIAQRKLGGAKYPRACYSSDYTGLKILHTLYDQAIKENIEFYHEHMVLDIIINNQSVTGVKAFDIKTGELKIIAAKNVVIASGGYAGVYHGYHTNSNATTGDLIEIALKAGCECENLEYVQFHPTALENSCTLISESARGEGGYLVDQNGDRFVDELSPRDIVARAIYKKIESGSKVYLDLRHLGIEKIMETMPQEYALVKKFTSQELDKELISITPATHYTMGGIKTNIDGETNINNLYAVGEVASNGVHGANRLGGNSLLEIITFGRHIGHVTSKKSLNTKKTQTINTTDDDTVQTLLQYPNKINFYEKRDQLGKLMYENVGLFRTEQSLSSALDHIKNIRQEIPLMGVADKSKTYNTNLKEFIEFIKMVEVSEAIVLSALNRWESRGAHYRKDFPNEESGFSNKTVLYFEENQYKIKMVPAI